MLNKKMLLQAGFKLNEYPEGKFYEFLTEETRTIENIEEVVGLDFDYECPDEKLILQCQENLSNKKICIDCHVWNLLEKEFEKIVEEIIKNNQTN